MYIEFSELIESRVPAKSVLKKAVYNKALLYWFLVIPESTILIKFYQKWFKHS